MLTKFSLYTSNMFTPYDAIIRAEINNYFRLAGRGGGLCPS